MIAVSRRHILFLLVYHLLAIFPSPAVLSATGTEHLFLNPRFEDVDKSGAPVGWENPTSDEGYVKVNTENGLPFVELGVEYPGKTSYIEQFVPLPSDARQVVLYAKFRWSNIEPGEKSYQRGKVQGRLTTAGQQMGGWIGLGSVSGSSEDWTEVARKVDIPDQADGVMMRLALYNVIRGRLDVSEVGATVVTEAEIAVERRKYRPAQEFGPRVSDQRYARLLTGVNINGWFCQPWNQRIGGRKGGYTPEFLRSYITGRDVRMIAEMGFRHVRLPVDPICLIDKKTFAFDDTLLGELDRAISLIRKQSLAVVVDIHPKTGEFKDMANKDPLREAFIGWWAILAEHLARTTDPEWVFLELLNEPGGQKYWADKNWQPYQDKLITVVRNKAPDHTIIANGGGYQLVRELPYVKPHPDRNIIWAIHYYEPSPFTHQGAQWMKDWYRPLRDVPWPLTAGILEETIAKLKDLPAREKSVEVLRDQVSSGLSSPQYMEAQIETIVKWGKEVDRRVIIGECGVVEWAPRASRLRYLDTLTAQFQRHNLAWSIWNHHGSAYSLMTPHDGEPGQRSIDTELCDLLHLKIE